MNQKGFAPILIVIIIAALIGGYLIYQNSFQINTPPPTTQLTSTPSPTLTSTPESTNSAETANWKIYTSSENIYSFRYPAEASVNTNANLEDMEGKPVKGITVGYGGPKQSTEFNNGMLLEFLPTVTINIPLKEYVDQQIFRENKNGKHPEGPAEVDFGGRKGITYNTYAVLGPRYIYLPVSDNRILLIVDLTDDPSNKGYQKMTDQILSTFKFLP